MYVVIQSSFILNCSQSFPTLKVRWPEYVPEPFCAVLLFNGTYKRFFFEVPIKMIEIAKAQINTHLSDLVGQSFSIRPLWMLLSKRTMQRYSNVHYANDGTRSWPIKWLTITVFIKVRQKLVLTYSMIFHSSYLFYSLEIPPVPF